jgi:hypothetical protein
MTKVSVFCKDNFEELTSYFNNVRLSDLRHLDEHDLVDVVEPEHRIMMISFARQHLSEYLGQEDSTAEDTRVWREESGQVDLSGRVHTNAIHNNNNNSPLLSCRNLSLRDIHDNPNDVQELVLSDNLLSDVDIPFIIEFCKTLPNLRIIRLDNNRFGGSEEIRQLLALTNVRYVNICHNPLATFSNRSFLRSLRFSELKKLVWVPFAWLEVGKWQSMFGDSKNKRRVIRKTHMKYELDLQHHR